MKNAKLIWGLCLIVMGLSGAALALNSIAGHTFPASVVRLLGICSLVSLPLFAFTTVQLVRQNTWKHRK